MPAKTNPFPGMNPFLQDHWTDVHATLITYLREALTEELPDDLAARAEERIVLEAGDGEIRSYRADIAVAEPWQSGFPPLQTWSPDTGEETGGDTLTAAVPFLFIEERMPERWIEVHDAGGTLITVIEILSPSNKTSEGAESYRQRQQHFLAGGIRLVEIDLIRGGGHALAFPRHRYTLPPGTCHVVCTTRMSENGKAQRHEVYPCPLREPLPTIRVPLRRGEPDVPLALQPAVDRCYQTGRYWLTLGSPAARKPDPPMADAAEAAWVEERRLAGIRG